MTIRYVGGDATDPIGAGQKVIVHVCNDVGKWGKGFVLAVSRRWKAPEKEYKAAFASQPAPRLGDVQFVRVTDSITVANLVGQHGIASRRGGPPPVRYDAIREGLQKVSSYAQALHASVHMPRIGCGLAGGDWTEVEPIIAETLTDENVEVTIYDYTAQGAMDPVRA